MNDEETKQLKKYLESLLEKISIIKSKIEIPPETHSEYISYHNKIDRGDHEYKKVIKESKELFLKDTLHDKKKESLFLLAHYGTLESFKIITKFLDVGEKDLKPWALISLEECRMFLESDIMDEGKGIVIGDAGRDGKRLRCYFVVRSSKKANFSDSERKIIRDGFKKTSKELDCKIKEIEFQNNFALITTLVSIDIAVSRLIEQGIEICNSKKEILDSYYFVTNVKKPSKEEITEFLIKRISRRSVAG